MTGGGGPAETSGVDRDVEVLVHPFADAVVDISLGEVGVNRVLHRVEVRPDHDHVVRVALLALGQHVEGVAELVRRVDEEVRRRGVRREIITDGVARADHRDAAARSAERSEEGTGAPWLSFVEDHHTRGTGVLGVRRLLGERARAALDDGDVARRESGEVRGCAWRLRRYPWQAI